MQREGCRKVFVKETGSNKPGSGSPFLAAMLYSRRAAIRKRLKLTICSYVWLAAQKVSARQSGGVNHKQGGDLVWAFAHEGLGIALAGDDCAAAQRTRMIGGQVLGNERFSASPETQVNLFTAVVKQSADEDERRAIKRRGSLLDSMDEAFRPYFRGIYPVKPQEEQVAFNRSVWKEKANFILLASNTKQMGQSSLSSSGAY